LIWKRSILLTGFKNNDAMRGAQCEPSQLVHMNEARKFDIIIAGAGPAGGLTGYYLAREGLAVLIIDKEQLPRYKACGGGLTRRTLDSLPFDVSDVIEEYVCTPRLYLDKKPIFSKTYATPLIAMVMRDRFDHFIIEKAIQAGATVQDGTAFRSVSGTAGNLTVETSAGVYRAGFIVGADGVNSRVRKALNLDIRQKVMTALEAEIPLGDAGVPKDFACSVDFDFGVIPEGYGWVFPKRERISAGVVSQSRKVRNIKQYLFSYLRTKQLHPDTRKILVTGHLIPYIEGRNNSYASDRGLVVGDAAGFTDPVTGEGIYYAAQGARVAADCILKWRDHDHGMPQVYDTALKAEFVDDLHYAARIGRLFYKLPALSSRMATKFADRIADSYAKVISGQLSYKQLFKERFSAKGLMRLWCAELRRRTEKMRKSQEGKNSFSS
jgi:geranylgeranyl reductase family protein